MGAKIFQSSTVLHLIQNQESANDDKNAAVLIAINTKHVADRCCWLLSGARPSLVLSKQRPHSQNIVQQSMSFADIRL